MNILKAKDEGKSLAEAFLLFLREQHSYFQKITPESAKMYADKFDQQLQKERAEEAKAEAEAEAKAKAEAEAKAKAETEATNGTSQPVI